MPRIVHDIVSLILVAAVAATSTPVWAQAGATGGTTAPTPATSGPPSDEPVLARAATAVRWKIPGVTVLVLEGSAEIRRGTSRLEAERAVIWIDEGRSHQAGRVIIDVYAEGNVATVEQGVRAEGPRVFFRWSAAKLTIDDADGFIELLDRPVATDLVTRAEAARAGKPIPEEGAPLPVREGPPAAVIPEGVAEPARVIKLYGQQQVGPDISSTVEDDVRVTVVTKYPDLVIQQPGFGNMEILAENIVIWLDEKKLKESGSLRDADLQIYAEGNVVIHQEGKSIHCGQLFYDYSNRRGLIVGGAERDAVIKTFNKARGVPLYYRAREFRQIDRDRYTAKNVMITNSEFGYPEWGITASSMNLTVGREEVVGEDGKTREEIVTERATLWNNVLNIGGLPFFYWPVFTRDLKNDKTVIKSVRMRNSNQYGFSLLTRWDLYDLGIYENDWSSLTFLFDTYSARGEGLGTEFKFAREDFWGELFGYTIHDTGTDKNDMKPEKEQRSRLKYQGRWDITKAWRLDAEFSWITDAQFLDEYWEKEFKEEKEQESLLYLRHLVDNRGFTVLFRPRVNDWQAQTEYMPEARFIWTGQPLWDGRFTYFQDTRFGNVRKRFGDEEQREYIGILHDNPDYPADYRAWRGITEHEIQYPVQVSIFKLAPYFNAEYAGYDAMPGTDGHDRLALTAGVRTSTQFWRIYDVYSRLWDINRLRHIITPTIDVHDTFELTRDNDEVYQFDRKDDADDTKVIRFGVRQRLQTRRLSRDVARSRVGGWRSVDWMMLDVEMDYFPDEGRHNNGKDLGPVEFDYWWQISDRLRLLADADVRVDHDVNVETFDVGFSVNRSPAMTLYLGQRYIDESNSNILIGKIDYKLDERWTVGLMGQVDVSQDQTNEYRITLRRHLHRWIMELGFERDAGQGDTVIMLMFMPQGLPEGKFRFF